MIWWDIIIFIIMGEVDFNQKLEERIRELIRDYKLIEEGELVAVALSGGKDSLLVLHVLADLRDDLGFDIVAITVDEGIKDYREKALEAARYNTKLLGVELVEKSFIEEFDFSLDDVYGIFKSPCIPCGVFRRHILNRAARSLGADKIATGHNMDDEIQSFMMSLVRGDTRKFSKFGPKLEVIHSKLIPRIKPLWNTSEEETRTWAILNNIRVHLEDCPYSTLSLRARIKRFLNGVESKRPGTKDLMMRSFIKTFKMEQEEVELFECEVCGEPASMRTCKACELLSVIRGSL